MNLLLKFVKHIFDQIKELPTKEELARKEELANVKDAAEYLFKLSLQCKKCNSYAVPVLGTEANYVCLKCDNRFVGSKHRLGQSLQRKKITSHSYPTSYISEYFYSFPYYDSAVESLKEQYN